MAKQYLLRSLRVVLGQIISGVGVVLVLQANIGTDPWSVLHQGISRVSGIPVGTVSILVGAAFMGLALLLGERIGVATIIGVTVPGVVIDLLLASGWVPLQTNFWSGLLMLITGLEILTVGTWYYLRECLGAGPRDAVNVALAQRTPFSVGMCRSAIEVLALLAGWLLGGQAGVGTVVSAFGIGILFQLNFRFLRFNAAGLRQENLAESWRAVAGKIRT